MTRPATVEESLLQRATQLAGRRIPVPLDAVVADLGVRVTWSKLSASHATVVKDDGGPIIVLPDVARGSPRHRFSLAHELGHLVLDELVTTGSAPLHAQEAEALCNKFAAELLLPTANVQRYLHAAAKQVPAFEEVVHGTKVARKLARDGGVSVQMACLAISRADGGVLFACVSPMRGRVGTKSGSIEALRVRWSTRPSMLPGGLFPFKRLPEDHVLSVSYRRAARFAGWVRLNLPPLPVREYLVDFQPYDRAGKDFLLAVELADRRAPAE